MSKNGKDDIVAAHKYCANHKTKLLKDKKCGCFHCMKIFSPSEITDWIEDDTDQTAICPHCGIDAIIGESSGFPITKEFLEKMYEHWFFIVRE
jgi:hypothetical protein